MDANREIYYETFQLKYKQCTENTSTDQQMEKKKKIILG